MTTIFLLLLLAQAATAPPATAPAPARRPPPPVVLSPFRLSLNYVHVLREDGDLANSNLSTNAVGIDMAFPSNNYVRNHLASRTSGRARAASRLAGFAST